MKFLLQYCLFLMLGTASAQTDDTWLSFHFAHAGLAVPEYTFIVRPEGDGTYTAKTVAPRNFGNRYATVAPSDPVETTQKLRLNTRARDRFFALLKETNGLKNCDSKLKGIADTGAKTLLDHEGSRADSTCTYNYSESKPVMALTELFQNMAFVMDEGRLLESEHKYDRLAMDAEMTTLANMVKDGHGAGLSNIEQTLNSIAADPQVLERVRAKANQLVQLASQVP